MSTLSRFDLFTGDCLAAMYFMEDDSVDSIVTDPPYGLSFMGKAWDHGVPSVAIWREALRVLKPGGHLLSFGGSRTYHRMASAIEDAGFEIRDQIMWVYGCLDEQTQVATVNGVMPYHKTKVGDLVLCYDAAHGTYSYQPILEVVEYDYNDTAYRITGDFGEQVVSRNHRVIVEHGGEEQFCLAENLNVEARVPFLESLPALQHALHDAQQNASCTKQDVQQGVCKRTDWAGEHRDSSFGEPQGQNDRLRGVREVGMETECVAAQDQNPNLQPGVQRSASRFSMGDACAQRPSELVGRVGSSAESAHDGRGKPGVEGRDNLPESEGCVCGSADQVRAVPCSDATHVPVGWLRGGAPHCGGVGDWANADTGRVCTPHQPRCNGQSAGESDVVCDELGAQEVRAWAGHKTSVVRVVPFEYTGKVWCLRVPTGAFVAVRNGVAFPTGNSGFPKSLDVGKAIDKAAGAERAVVGFDAAKASQQTRAVGTTAYGDYAGNAGEITAPATDAAKQWDGWGTALKPAHEPIVVARKPLIGTVAANVLAHGTGALNIDGCRVGDEMRTNPSASSNEIYGQFQGRETVGRETVGRWPANLIFDGSDEVLAAFPDTKSGGYPPEGGQRSHVSTYGAPTKRGEQVFTSNAGSAARFFYCAKASKKDRNGGLNGHETVILEWSLTLESPKWDNVDQRVTLQVDTGQSPPKVIAVSGASRKNAIEWSMLLFGNAHTAPSLKASTCIIEMPTSSTTGLTTLSYFQNLLTNENTQVANSEMVSGGSPAQTAAPGTLLLRTTGELMASALGVAPAASPMLLKISASERRSDHPTVKPTDLMAYLCRLVTPPGGLVFDPFTGSGSTGKAALREGFRFTGAELDPEYAAIARARLEAASYMAIAEARVK